MERDDFDRWLAAYGRAWETKDAQAVAGLFAEDAAYYETPFDEPMRGRAAVVDYWLELPGRQDEIRFEYEVLAVANDTGIAHWRASFVRLSTGARVTLDGILTATFDGANRCTEFREWWHRQEV